MCDRDCLNHVRAYGITAAAPCTSCVKARKISLPTRSTVSDRKIWRLPRSRRLARYDLAILHDPQEALPPSNAKALDNFVRVGKTLGIDVELIERKDYARIAEYDGLLIRETTSVDNHTCRFAKKAESEGLMPVS